MRWSCRSRGVRRPKVTGSEGSFRAGTYKEHILGSRSHRGLWITSAGFAAFNETRMVSRAQALPASLAGMSFTLNEGLAAGQSVSRLRAKDLRIPSRGIRVPGGVPQSLAARVRPYLEVSPGSVASDGTAARLLNVPLPGELEEEPYLHLSSVSSRNGPRRKHVIGHARSFDPGEVTVLDGIRVTTPARTWLDLAAVLGLEDLVIAGDFLVCTHEERGFGRSGPPLVSLNDLSLYVAGKRRVPGLVRARKALPFLRVGVDSPRETRLRLMLENAQHLPAFRWITLCLRMTAPFPDRWTWPALSSVLAWSTRAPTT